MLLDMLVMLLLLPLLLLLHQVELWVEFEVLVRGLEVQKEFQVWSLGHQFLRLRLRLRLCLQKPRKPR